MAKGREKVRCGLTWAVGDLNVLLRPEGKREFIGKKC